MDEEELQARALAIRYGHEWLRKVFPSGRRRRTAAQDDADAADESPVLMCPVDVIVMKRDSGEPSRVVFGRELPLLEPGGEVFRGQPSKIADPVHPSMPTAHYLSADNSFYSNNLPE